MNTLHMDRFSAAACLVIGVLDAAVMGILALAIVDFGWSTPAAVSAVAFLASATVLMRAPFSKRNIDRRWVSALRGILVLFLAFFEYEVAGVVDMLDLDPVEAAIVATALATIALLILVPKMRRPQAAF